MSWFVDTAWAMGAGGGGAAGGEGNMLVQMAPLLFMFAIFYFMLIRPQQKKAKEHKAMLDAIQRGDEIITAGGLHGKVTGVTDDTLTVEIAQNVKVKLQRSSIAEKR